MIEPAAPKLTHNEIIKQEIPTLAGNIAAMLADPAADRFSEDDAQFIKFHGIYQQDDRDTRKTAKQFIFMVRGRIPGGILSRDLYLTYDRLATQYANNTLRITSRQSFQFHGIVKQGLGPLMRGINDALSTTLAACGDVNRNVMASPTPPQDEVGVLIQEDAKLVSDSLLPTTQAYHSIWVDGVQLNLQDEANKNFVDPLYGKTYLPRKFKIAFAVPPVNDVDIFTNDLGFAAIVENGKLTGYNLLAGGGLGMSHGNADTFPRVGDTIAFITRDQLVAAAKGVLTIHRDFGDRTNRKHARLKYVLAERGVAWFRAELEQRVGAKLADAKPIHFTKQGDVFGWNKQSDGNLFLGLYVETGRIKDKEGYRLKSALRQIVTDFGLEVRLTPSQNLLLTGIKPADQAAITKILADNGIPVEKQTSALRRASMACPAMPTCGLALAESERMLPGMMGQIEQALAATGLQDEEIIVRSTGCPNGCARPYMAEIGFVGKAPNKYQIYLGGNEGCTRLNRLYKEGVKTEEVLGLLTPLFQRYAAERTSGERFGDWVARTIWPLTAAAN